MHLPWNGNDYLTCFKCLVGRCRTNTADRPAVWVCCLLNNQGFVLWSWIFGARHWRVSKGCTARLWEKSLSLLEMIILICACLYACCLSTPLRREGICLPFSLLNSQCLRLSWAHHRSSVNMSYTTERVPSVGSVVRLLNATLDKFLNNTQHPFFHP